MKADDIHDMASPLENSPPGSETSFPDPIVPDGRSEQARIARLSDLTRVTLFGILIRLVVITAEFIGVWISNSAALFVDAVSSLFDIFSSLILLAAIRFAARPPDQEHPFGHGRAEPLAGFQLGLLLSITGGWMMWQIGQEFRTPMPHHSIARWLWIIPAFATCLIGIATSVIRRTSRESNSTALRAEAAHFQIDMLTSLVTTITLIAVAVWREQADMIDQVGAILLAAAMIALGIQASWENVNQLLDHVPNTKDFERVRKSALKTPGVREIEKLLIQHTGPDVHVNIDIEVDPEITVAASHLIAQQVRARIQSDWYLVRDVIVHVEPYYPGDHA